MSELGYRFSVGPWNLSEGSDPFGHAVRSAMPSERKLAVFRELGFEGVMFHDDDIVPELESLTPAQAVARAKDVKRQLDNLGMVAEIFAPRLWEHPKWADGAYTSNDPAIRREAVERSKRAIDIGREVGCDLMVFWMARDGAYVRESKDPARANRYIVDALNACLAYDPKVRIAIEPKPNEPMDISYCPTVGHALALASLTSDPKRVGGLIESAHAILAGLDPAEEMAFALTFNKLWSVHLNDQNGLKYDQDRGFGTVNLRTAFNQVKVLEEHGYAKSGAFVAFDTKPLRTARDAHIAQHLATSKKVFLALVEKYRSLDMAKVNKAIGDRDYDSLDLVICEHLLGR